MRILMTVILFLAIQNGFADVLLIEEVRHASNMELPKQGQSMNDVQSRYGEPETRHGAVGDPPISRWDYDDFSVYFEHNLVLSSVLHPGAVLQDSDNSE